MIGIKRNKSKGRSRNPNAGNKRQIKHKPLEERLKSARNDEEIMSGSDEERNDNMEEDDFFEDEAGEKMKNKAKAENADEKRLRLAKKLISRIGEEVKSKEEEEMNFELGVDQFIMSEVKKEKQEHFMELSTIPNFNPVQTSFHKGHLAALTAVDISSDSKVSITCSKDCRAIKWDLQTGKKFLLPQFTTKPLYACMFTPDDKYALFAGADKHIHQMDLHNETIVQSFKAHNDTVTGLVFDQNKDQFYSSSKDNTLKVWAVGTTQKSILIETFYGHIDKINDMDIIPGGTGVNRILTCGSDRQINLWKVDSQSFLQFKESDLNLFSYDCVRSLNNDYFIAGTYEGALSLWRGNKKRAVCKIPMAHGVEKNVSLRHSFFNQNSLEDEDKANITTHAAAEDVSIPYPIMSLACIKNSDVLFSGSSDGNLNVYRYHKAEKSSSLNLTTQHVKEKIELIKKVPLNYKGCVNAMKVNKTNEFLVLANGKDCRLGRWDTQDRAKNGISIVKLFD